MAWKKQKMIGNKGPFGLYLVLLSVPILALQGMVYVQIVDQTVGAFPIMKRFRMAGEQQVQEPKVAVLRSDFNAAVSGPKPEYYYDLSAFWDFQVQSAGLEHKLIGDNDLAEGLGNKATVLVLPWATCLSSRQKQAVRDFLNAGNSVIASGPTGARDENNDWVGWEFLTELTGLMQPVSITPEEQTYASVRGDQFYSANIPAGLLLDLPKHVLTVGVANSPDIYWSDSKWRPESVDWPSEAALGLHGVYGKGRIVWVGFNERLSGNPKTRPFVDNYVRAAIQWTGRQPLSVPAMWPERNVSAAVPMGDFGSDIRGAQEVADLIHAEDAKGTLFIQSGSTYTAPASVSLIRESVELATTGDGPESLSGQSLVKQVERLKKAKQELNRPNYPLVGFKPLQNVWTVETAMALRTAGYGYYLDSTGNQRAVPELIEFRVSSIFGPRVELSRIPSLWSEDLDVVADYTGPTPWKDDLGDALVKEFELGRYLGGLYTLGFRGDLLGAKENRHILASVLRRMKRPNVWLTSGAELANWWSKRAKIRVESRRVHQHRIRIAVTNRGRQDVNLFGVELYLPYRPKKVRILSEILGKTLPQYELLPGGDDILRLEFNRLKRESSQVFLVSLDES